MLEEFSIVYKFSFYSLNFVFVFSERGYDACITTQTVCVAFIREIPIAEFLYA